MSQAIPIQAAQQARLRQFECTRAVDIHCHVLPGIDDGPRTLADALAVARLLVDDGFTDVIATPHQLGRWDGANSAADIRQAVTDFQKQLDLTGIPLRIHPGGEVRLDERIATLLARDVILTMADQKKTLLLELPAALTIEPEVLAMNLQATQAKFILAHAERYESLASTPASAERWLQAGVALQVNASSLLGDSGEHAENAAWEWMARGWVALIASDAHSVNSRRPKMTIALADIVQRLGIDAARRACIDNPLRVLEGARSHLGLSSATWSN